MKIDFSLLRPEAQFKLGQTVKHKYYDRTDEVIEVEYRRFGYFIQNEFGPYIPDGAVGWWYKVKDGFGTDYCWYPQAGLEAAE